MVDDDSEILTILYGEEVTEEEVNTVSAYVEEHYEDVEVEVHNGSSRYIHLSFQLNKRIDKIRRGISLLFLIRFIVKLFT